MRAWPALPEHPVVSLGHAGGRFVAQTRVSPEARDAYLRLVDGTALPDGTVVAKFHENPQGAPGPVYVMRKHGGAWTYLLVLPDGTIDAEGALDACARCHAEAVADHLFGPPRSAGAQRESDSGAAR